MGDPHNKNKYGITWDENHKTRLLEEIAFMREYVTISGGWAWCLMTPPHEEYKHAHDLKDIDAFVYPEVLGLLVTKLKTGGWGRVHTKYDKLSPFYRYEKIVDEKKIILDLFVQDITSTAIQSSYVGALVEVVHPERLIPMYGAHNPDSLLHGSGQCWSLHNAKSLVSKGEYVVGNPKMADFTKWLGN